MISSELCNNFKIEHFILIFLFDKNENLNIKYELGLVKMFSDFVIKNI